MRTVAGNVKDRLCLWNGAQPCGMGDDTTGGCLPAWDVCRARLGLWNGLSKEQSTIEQ